MPTIQRISSAFKIGDYVWYHYTGIGKQAKKVYQIVEFDEGSGLYKVNAVNGWVACQPAHMLKKLTDSELAWHLLTNGK